MLLMVLNMGSYFSNLIYMHMYGLLNKLCESNVGCHIGGVFTGVLTCAFGDAHDCKLLTPIVHTLRILANICEKYAFKYDITFNGKKRQLIIYKCKRAWPPDRGIFINKVPYMKK